MRLEAAQSVSPTPEEALRPTTPPAPVREPRTEPSAATSEAPPQDQGARLSTRLRIEVDELAAQFVRKKFVRDDREPIWQWPSDSHLYFARAVRTALSASVRASIDVKA